MLYYVGDNFYPAAGDLLKDAAETTAYWKAYRSTKKPKVVKNKKKYAYAIIVDLAGNKTYLSTGALINDSVNPKMSSVAMSESEDGTSGTINAKGTDTLSGVDKFLFVYKEMKDGKAKDPSKEDILSKGTEIKVSSREDNSASGTFTVKKLEDDKDYIFYVLAVDAAGNVSDFKSRTLRSNSRIEIGDYTSSKLRTEDSTAFYSRESQKATIISENAKGIAFYVSDKFFASPDDINAEIKEKDSMWKTYSSSYKPTTVKDQKNYIYAKITKDDGSVVYMSTGAVVFDTVAPKMTTGVAAPSEDGKSTIVAMGGKDELSGINRFKFLYSEKVEGENTKTPSKDYVFDNGTYVEVSRTEDGVSMGSYNISDLDPLKKYSFFFVAVDRADNVSEVLLQEIDGADAATGDAQAAAKAKADAEKAAANSALIPAPNGIAGSGEKQKSEENKGSGSGSGSGAKEEAKSESTDDSSNVTINRDPFIADATGDTKIGLAQTGGWTKISNEVKVADKGAVIEVEMAGTSNVSSQLFSAMSDRDVSVKLRMPNNVQWEIKGDSVAKYAKGTVTDRDMGVKLGSRNIPDQRINEVVGTNPHVEFSMTSKEDFGFEANITVPSDKSHAGMNATLYKYDEEQKEMTIVGTAVVDENGNIEFPITEAADYTVVISPEKLLTASDTVITDGIVLGDEEATKGGMIMFNDIFGKRGGAPIWLFVIAIISAGLCIAILYMPNFQSGNDDDFQNLA